MKTVLITGANRGIGLEFVKQLSEQGMRVFACCRQPEQATELRALAERYSTISIYPLDVTNQSTIDALTQQLADQSIDWVINNAGTSGEQGVTIGNIDRENFLSVFDANCLGVVKVSEAFLPQLKQSHEKLIVVISSRMGSISDNDRGRSYAYRTSKAAVNCVMRSFALDVADEGVRVMLMHPGWVKTRMGGEDGLISAAESVSGILEQIDKHKQNAHAQALLRFDGGTIAW